LHPQAVAKWPYILRPAWAGRTTFNKKEQAFLDALKDEYAVITSSALAQDGKPFRDGYIGRFRIANFRIDAEGLKGDLIEQVARAVNVPTGGPRPKARRGLQLRATRPNAHGAQPNNLW
jgi:hypothetical protein